MCVCVSHCRFSRRRRSNSDVIDFFSHELHFVATTAARSSLSQLLSMMMIVGE